MSINDDLEVRLCEELTTSIQNQQKDVIIQTLRQLTDEQRKDIFSNFCNYCGSNDPGCACWNDD